MKKISLILFFLFNLAILNFSNANGMNCNSAYPYQIGQELHLDFSAGQTQMYFEFNATSQQAVLQITEYQNIYSPLDLLDTIRVFEHISCANLNQLAQISKSSLEHANALTLNNLNIGQDYLIVLERSASNSTSTAPFGLFSNYIIVSAVCQDQAPCMEEVRNGQFTYATTDTTTPNKAFDGEICFWENESGSPDHWSHTSTNRDFAGMGSVVYSNSYIIESISTGLKNPTASGDQLVLTADLARGFANGLFGQFTALAPEEIKFLLVKSSDLNAIAGSPAVRQSTILSILPDAFEMGVVQGFQLQNQTFSSYSFCKTVNDSYDRLLILAENQFAIGSLTYFEVDNVSLINLKDMAGEDVEVDVCTVDYEPITIGNSCDLNGFTYSWSPATGLSSSTVAQPEVDLQNYASSYTLTMTHTASGCIHTDQVNFNVNNLPAPTLRAGEDITWGEANINDISLVNNEYISNNATFVVEGDFTVDADWTLTDCKLYMKEDAKIIVTNGATLKFDGHLNHSFIKPCEESWKGIVAFGEAGVHIEDAHPFYGSDLGITLIEGADLYAKKIDFRQNKRCIYAESSLDTQRDVEFLVEDCDFKSDIPFPTGVLFNAYYPQKAIEMKFLYNTGFVVPLIKNNKFFGSAGGIEIRECEGVFVDYNEFRDFYNVGLPPYPGNAAKATTAIKFYGTPHAAFAPPSYHAKHNRFWDTHTAIRNYDRLKMYTFFNGFNVDLNTSGGPINIYEGVPGNTFFIGSNNNVVNGGTKGRIQLSADRVYGVNSGFELYNTDVSLGGIDATRINCVSNEGSTGIIIDNSNLSGNTNHIVADGGKIEFAHKAITLFNVSSGYTGGSIVDIEDYTPPSDPCTDPNQACPCLNPPCNFPLEKGYGIRAVGSVVNISASFYEIALIKNPSTGIPNLNTEGIISEFGSLTISCIRVENMGTGIRFEGLNTLNLINSSLRNNYIDMHLNNYGEVGTHGDPAYGIATEWESSPPLGYDIFTSNNTNGSLSTFYFESIHPYIPTTLGNDGNNSSNAVVNTTAPFTVNSCAFLRKKAKTNPNPKKEEWIKRQQKRAKSLSGNKARYEAQLAYWAYQADSSLQADSSSVKSYGDSLSALPFGKIMKALRNGESDSAIKSIAVVHQFDKDVRFAARMNTRLMKKAVLDSLELNRLRSLAAACPTDKGVAVFQARNVLGQMGDKGYWNPCEGVDTTQKGKVKRLTAGTSNNSIILYPNPAANSLNLEIAVEANSNTIIRFFDLLGKEVYAQQLQEGELHSLSTETMTNGIYFYRLEQNGSLLQSGKQIIQR